MRRLVLSGLAAALGLACSGTTDVASPGQVGRGTGTSVHTTTEPTTATTILFETEVKRAAIELLEIRNDVFQHPDVSRVSEYIADTCTCLERERGYIERFVEEGLRWRDPPIEVRGVRVASEDSSMPELTLVARQPGTQVVTSDGETHAEIAAKDTAAYSLSIIRVGRGWRLNSLEGITLDEATSAAVLAEGLPQ